MIDDWKKFAEAYSLDLDHLLVFKYVGRSEFQVVILDQSGLEMSYPLTEATLDGEDNGNSLPQSKRASSPLPFSPSTKKVKTNTRKETNAYPLQDEDVETKCAQSKRNKAKKRGVEVDFFSSLFCFLLKVLKVLLLCGYFVTSICLQVEEG